MEWLRRLLGPAGAAKESLLMTIAKKELRNTEDMLAQVKEIRKLQAVLTAATPPPQGEQAARTVTMESGSTDKALDAEAATVQPDAWEHTKTRAREEKAKLIAFLEEFKRTKS